MSQVPEINNLKIDKNDKTLLANCQRNRLAIALRHKSACYIAEVLTFINFTPNQLRFIGSLISNYMFLHRQKLLRLPLNYDFMLICHERYHLSYLSLSCSSGLFSYLSFHMNWKKNHFHWFIYVCLAILHLQCWFKLIELSEKTSKT